MIPSRRDALQRLAIAGAGLVIKPVATWGQGGGITIEVRLAGARTPQRVTFTGQPVQLTFA